VLAELVLERLLEEVEVPVFLQHLVENQERADSPVVSTLRATGAGTWKDIARHGN